ncbi:MAG: DMT family transporter [Campylobacterota bacterium]|nr:DMT family transporter [Campylobacterota bacterium]
MHVILLMILAMILWGIGWPALKIVTATVPADVVTFWRFLIMLIAFIPILIGLNKPIHFSKKVLLITFFSALLNIAFMFLSFWGVKVGSAGAGGVIITTISPILTMILAIFIFNAKVKKKQWIGLAIGLFGGVVMLELWSFNLLQGGDLYFLLSALVWAILTLVSQKSHAHLEPIHYSFLLAVMATPLMFALTYDSDLSVVFTQGVDFWIALLYLGIFGQTIASTIYFFASGRLGSGVASSYMFLVPLSALIASYILLEELPSQYLLIGGIISTLGLYFVHEKRKNQLK